MSWELLVRTALVNKLPPVAHASYAMYLLTALLLLPPLIFILMAKRGRDLYIRRIPGIDAIEEAVGRATELGRPMMFTTGLTGIGPLLYALLGILRSIAAKAAAYGCRLIVPQNDYEVLPIVEETVREAFRGAGRLDQFNPRDVRFLSPNQFAFASGYMGIAHREAVASCFLFGDFAAESLILAEAGQQVGAMQVAGTSSYTQVPFFLTSCDYTIIGEEVYAAGAYLSRDPAQLGSVRGQDVAKLVILAIVLIGTVWATCLSVSRGDYREGREYNSPFARAFYVAPEQKRLLARIETASRFKLEPVPKPADFEAELASARERIRRNWDEVRRRLRTIRELAAAEERHLRGKLELFPAGEGRSEADATAEALAEVAARAALELGLGPEPAPAPDEDADKGQDKKNDGAVEHLAGLIGPGLADAERRLIGKLRERTAARLAPEAGKLAHWASLYAKDDADLGPAGPTGMRLAELSRLLASAESSAQAMTAAMDAARRDCLAKYADMLRPSLRGIADAAAEQPPRHRLRTASRLAEAGADGRPALGRPWPLVLDGTRSVSGRGRPLALDYVWTVSPRPSAERPAEFRGPKPELVFDRPGEYTVTLKVAESLRPIDNAADLTLSIEGKESTEVDYDSMPAGTTIMVKWRQPKGFVAESEILDIDFGEPAASPEERTAKSRHTYSRPGRYCMTVTFSGKVRAETLTAAQLRRAAAAAAAAAGQVAPELVALRERLGRTLSDLTENLGKLGNELNSLTEEAGGYGEAVRDFASKGPESWPDAEKIGGASRRAGDLARFATAKANFLGPKAGAAEVFGAGRPSTEDGGEAPGTPGARGAAKPEAAGTADYWKRYRIYWTVLERLEHETTTKIVVEEAPVLPLAPWRAEPPAKAAGGGP